MPKKKHDIMTCSYCGNIIFLLLLEAREIRFNELYRLTQEYIGKFSKPTLLDHLKPLVKEKIVKRNNRGVQKITYSLRLDNIPLPKNLINEEDKAKRNYEILRKKPIKSLMVKFFEIRELAEAMMLKLWFQQQLLDKNVNEVRSLKFGEIAIERTFDRIQGLLLNAMKDRGALRYREYENAIELLKKVIEEKEKRASFDTWS